MTRSRSLVEQLVVRVDAALADALRADAEANGRTVAQSVRFHLRHLSTPLAALPKNQDGEPATDASHAVGGAPAGPRRAAPTAPGPAGTTDRNNEREN